MRIEAFGRIKLVRLVSYGKPLITMNFGFTINFLLEEENNDRLSFNTFREKGKFVTVYRKKTFSGVYNNFNSFIPETYRTGLIKSLLFRCFSSYSDFVKLHHEINI